MCRDAVRGLPRVAIVGTFGRRNSGMCLEGTAPKFNGIFPLHAAWSTEIGRHVVQEENNGLKNRKTA